MLECLLYNSIEDKFKSLFEDVVLGTLKSCFRLDYQVDISVYHMDATIVLHSRELTGLT